MFFVFPSPKSDARHEEAVARERAKAKERYRPWTDSDVREAFLWALGLFLVAWIGLAIGVLH